MTWLIDPPRDEGAASAAPQSPPSGNAVDICNEALRLVGGDRADTHGDKEQCFSNIAKLWQAYFEATWGTPVSLRATQVGDLMELLKIARRLTGAFNIDDYVDAAGYAACTGEIAVAREARKRMA